MADEPHAAPMDVSVVIPCYNVGSYIERCLHSIFDQGIEGLEIICVDDGSEDDTAERIRTCSVAAGRAVRLIQQPNRGASVARNVGAAEAKGAYIQFMDADDILLPGKIGHQLELARSEDPPDLIIGSFRSILPDGSVLRTVIQNDVQRDPWLDLMEHRLSGTPQNLWKRRTVEAVGGWDPTLRSSQEYDLMFRMLKQGARVVYDNAVLTEVHLRSSGSISQKDPDQNWARYIRLRSQIVEYIGTNRPGTDLRPYHQALFDSIRTLYPFDRRMATELFHDVLPKDFEPGVSTATGKGYLMLHKFFGFDLANRIRMYMAKH